jgi:hypothetical protein
VTKNIISIIEGKDFDTTIDLARVTAMGRSQTVLIMRHAKGSGQLFPVLEVSPQGDVLEIPPTRLSTTLGERFAGKVEELNPKNPQHVKSLGAYGRLEQMGRRA